jgi:hypothetical protein
MAADFIAYSGYGLSGILKGLEFGNTLAKVFLPVMGLTVMLSLYKMVGDFSKGDWKKGFLHIAMVSLGFGLWESTTQYSVASINLVGWIEKVLTKRGPIYGKEVEASPSGNVVAKMEAPSMYLLFDIPESIGVALANVMLTQNKDKLYQSKYLKLYENPEYLFALAFAKWVTELPYSDEGKFEELIALAYEVGALDVLRKKYGEEGKQLADKLYDLANVSFKEYYSYGKRICGYLKAATDIVKELPEGYETIKTFYAKQLGTLWGVYHCGAAPSLLAPYVGYGYSAGEKIAERTTISFRIPVLADGIAAGLYNAFKAFATSQNKDLSEALAELDKNTIGAFISHLFSKMKEFYANLAASKEFNIKLMLTIQKFAYVVLFILLPLVIILAFTPIGKYNLKLLFEFLIGYLLVKLWVPLLVFAHLILLGNSINSILPYLSKILPIPSVAFAETSPEGAIAQVILALQAMQYNADLNSAVLNTLAVLIPSILGGGSILLWSRSLITGIRVAAVESWLAVNSLLQTASFLLSAGVGGFRGFVQGFRGGADVVVGGIKTVEATSDLLSSERIFNVGGKTGRVVQESEKEVLVDFGKSSLWVPKTAGEFGERPITPQPSFGEKFKQGVTRGSKEIIARISKIKSL